MLALTVETIQFKDVNQAEVIVLENSLIEVSEPDEYGIYIAEYYGFLFSISKEEFEILC